MMYTSNALKRLSMAQLREFITRLERKRQSTGKYQFGWIADRARVESNRRFWNGERA